MTLLGSQAGAASTDTGTDFDLNWHNTVRLSATDQLDAVTLNGSSYCSAYESVNASAYHPSARGCGYGAGFNSGRIDWLSELEANYRGYGVLVSSAAWYDEVDHAGSTRTLDGRRVASSTSELGGRNIELFNGFFHGTTAVGDDQRLSFRIGRQTLVWGESLYFGRNGIAGGQTPIDGYRVQTTTGYGTNDALLPVGQATFRWQGPDEFAFEGYYQFEWRRNRLNPRDAYTGPADILGAQGNTLIRLTAPRSGTDYYYFRLPDRQPDSAGQFGAAMKWHRDDFDFGLYGLRFDAKSPEIYLYLGNPDNPRSSELTYRLEYPEAVELYGVSLSGPLGNANFGAELSARRNMPLAVGGVFVLGSAMRWADNDRHPLYPVGDTLHAQFSWNYVLPPLPAFPDGASWTGEIAANSLLETTANADRLTPGRTRSAAAFRTVFEPRFLQILPRVDLSIPLGFAYNFYGLSEIDPTMNRGTGDISAGLTVTIDQTWKAGFNFTHYFGVSKDSLAPFNRPGTGSPLAEWDFIAMSVERSF